MEAIALWIPLLSLLAGLLPAAGAYWISRRKLSGEVQLVSADTYQKLVTSVETQDERMAKLRDEIDELRERVRVLEERSNAAIGYTRRLVNQLRREGIKPDLPQEVIDELFSGSGSGAGV